MSRKTWIRAAAEHIASTVAQDNHAGFAVYVEEIAKIIKLYVPKRRNQKPIHDVNDEIGPRTPLEWDDSSADPWATKRKLQ